eukprot:1823521-Lingulodinium_polyedra.AAC.1
MHAAACHARCGTPRMLLCRAVRCCAMLRRAVPCCAMRAVPCHSVPRMLRHAMHVVPCMRRRAMHAVPC